MFTTGQSAVATTVPKVLVVAPPGPGAMSVTCVSGTGYIGFGTNLSSSNGFLIPAGGFLQPLPLFQGGGGGTCYMVGTATFSWIISAASAQTGF